jgi:hypothetical protein
MQNTTERKDVYSRITAQIVESWRKAYVPGSVLGMPNMLSAESRGHCVRMASPIPESMFCRCGCRP